MADSRCISISGLLNSRKIQTALANQLPGEVSVRFNRSNRTYHIYYRWLDKEAEEHISSFPQDPFCSGRGGVESYIKYLIDTLEDKLKPINKKKVTMDKLTGRDGPHHPNLTYLSIPPDKQEDWVDLYKAEEDAVLAWKLRYEELNPKKTKEPFMPYISHDSDKEDY